MTSFRHFFVAATVAAAAMTARSGIAGAQPQSAPSQSGGDQSPAPAPAPVPAEAEAPQQALPPAPPPPDLLNLIDQADQQARIATRKVELLEEQLATKAKDAAVVTADEKGFGIRSGDGAYVLRIRGLLQADSRWFLNDGALSDKADTFAIRRLRPALEGTLFGLADFRFTPDFAGGAVAVFDAYADVHPFAWLRVRAGKFKSPLGLERLQSDADVPLIERALTQYLTPTRDVGANLYGDIAGGVVQYNLGIYNGSPDNANQDVDANHAKDFVGRLLVQPFKLEGLQDLGALGVHFAVSTGNRFGTPTNPQLPAFRSAGLNTFFVYLPGTATDLSTIPFAHLRQTRINPGLFYYLGGLGVLGEFVQSKQEVQKGNTVVTLTHRAAHATASFVIGGKNGYDGPTPTNRFDLSKGTLGALEIAVRWNYLKLDDDTFPAYASHTTSANKAQGFGVAANFVPSRTLRISTTFEQTYFTGGAAASGDRKTENVILERVQVNF
jgi:phosphate-selective porin OprO/OprP